MAVLTLTEKLDQLGARYDELTQQLSTAEVASDSARYQKVAKQHAELEEIVEKHRQFKQIEKDLAGAHQMFIEAEDAEMKQMAHDEEKHLQERKDAVERELKLLLLPKDPNDEKSVIVEIRAGTGGDEAALFAAELCRDTGLESGNSRKLAVFARRIKRSCRRDSGQQSLFKIEIRKRRAPCPACSRHRNTRPHSHFRGHRCGSS